MRIKTRKFTPMYWHDVHSQTYDNHGLHPADVLLKPGRIPHIWCPGCGLGIVLNAFVNALIESKIDPKKMVVVSGIGCTGRVAGYLNMDTYHTTHGRAIPFATGLYLANPDLKIVVFSGDGDLFAIGGNHFIHAARRNVNLNVICVNNFNYGMTGGQVAPTTPVTAKTSTTPYGNYEHPFNLPHVAWAAGAVYVARWTTFHARYLKQSIKEVLNKKGFTFTEIISQCPTGFGRPNKLGDGLEEMRYYQQNSTVMHNIHPDETEIGLRGKIIVGKFIDVEKPTFLDVYNEGLLKKVSG